MEIQLFVKCILPVVSGVSKSGKEWKKQEYVGETIEQYPRKVVFSMFGDTIDNNPIEIAKKYVVSFDLESRNWNDRNGNERWSTEVRAWKAELAADDRANAAPITESNNQQMQTQPTQAQMDAQANAYFDQQPSPEPSQSGENLPF